MNRQWLNWRPSLLAGQSAEVVLLSLVAIGLSFWIHPQDPLALQSGFPWAWLAPVLLALRYGMLVGLVSAALLMIGWLLIGHRGTLPDPMPTSMLLGALILTMICGEFSGMWRNRHRRQSELNQYLDQRLEELTRQHYLLKLSHDRLEQNLISRPYTLRGALAELRGQLRQANDQESLPGAVDFLALLAAHCQLTTAGLYPAKNGELTQQPVAHCGEAADLSLTDSLVTYALQQRTLVHINKDAGTDDLPSHYLVAAPIYRDGELAGLLAITHMPFFAFHHDTLQTLAALLSYYADTFTSTQAHQALEHYPDCPPEFAENLARLGRVQQDSGVKSHLATLRFPADARGADIRHRMMRTKRELDFYWLHDGAAPLLIALFPLTDDEGMQGYLARVNAWLELEYGNDSRGLGIQFHSQVLEPHQTTRQLEALINHAA